MIKILNFVIFFQLLSLKRCLMHGNNVDKNQIRKYFLENSQFFEFLRQQIENVEIKFICPRNLGVNPAKDIAFLSPKDIKVVGALGDSLTAAVGSNGDSIIESLVEYRGKSFSMGGQDGAYTLVNFLRKYNSNIQGYSFKSTFLYGDSPSLNLAKSGSTSKDLVEQADVLIKRIKEHPKIDIINDWKMITIFVGSLDVCRSCEAWQNHDFTPYLFGLRIKMVLDRLKSQLPRTFVNVIKLIDISMIKYLKEGISCHLVHLFLCPCISFAKDPNKIRRRIGEFNSALVEAILSGGYDECKDFGVIIHSLYDETNINPFNFKKYIAADCMHFNGEGQKAFAIALWNSLFSNKKSKLHKIQWYSANHLICPTRDNPYFITKMSKRNIL